MPIKHTIVGKPAQVQVFTDAIDGLARKQLGFLADLPIVHHHVAAMPDVHPGMGSTVVRSSRLARPLFPPPSGWTSAAA